MNALASVNVSGQPGLSNSEPRDRFFALVSGAASIPRQPAAGRDGLTAAGFCFQSFNRRFCWVILGGRQTFKAGASLASVSARSMAGTPSFLTVQTSESGARRCLDAAFSRKPILPATEKMMSQVRGSARINPTYLPCARHRPPKPQTSP